MSRKLRLGIDTSSGRIGAPRAGASGAPVAAAQPFTATVALAAGNTLLQCLSFAGEKQAESILEAIDRLLSAQGCTLSQINELVLTTGPGSFTGMRTALSTAVGLAWSAERTVVGVANLLLPFAAATPGETVLGTVQCASDEWFAIAGMVDDDAGIRSFVPLTRPLLATGKGVSALENLLSRHRGQTVARLPYLPTSGAEQLLAAADFIIAGSERPVPQAAIDELPSVVSLPEMRLLQRGQGGAGIELLYGKGANARTLEERGIVPAAARRETS